MSTLLLKNCFYALPEAGPEGMWGADILITDNIITNIVSHGSSRAGNNASTAGQADRVIDCSNHVVIPGLVNTHHHFYQTLTRNIPAVQNAKLFDWLVYLYEIWKKIEEEDVYNSSLVAMGELLKTGCTLTTDHHYLYPNGFKSDLMGLQFQAAEDLGIRFSPTRGSMSLGKKDGGLPPDSVVQSEDQIMADSERVIARYHDSGDFSMNKVVLAPCSPFSVSEELMKESAALARRHGVYLHTHLAETSDEDDFCVKVYGRRPLKVMEDCDFVGPDVWYAHGIFFNDDELQVLLETGTGVAHCPSSNMRLGSGICRVTEMLSMGINVALAVDGSASNDTSDMLGEARNALLLQRVKYGSGAITAADVYKIATENGARMLNYAKVGKIKPGWAADLAIYDINKLEYCGALSDPGAALLFSGYNHGAAYTIVNGRVVVEKGRLCGIDEDDLISKANRSAHKLLQ